MSVQTKYGFKCPACKKTISTSPEMAGKKVRCSCSQRILIPSYPSQTNQEAEDSETENVVIQEVTSGKPNSLAVSGFVLAVLSVPMCIIPPLSFILAVIAFWCCAFATVLCFFGRRGIGFAFPGMLVAAVMVYTAGFVSFHMMSALTSR